MVPIQQLTRVQDELNTVKSEFSAAKTEWTAIIAERDATILEKEKEFGNLLSIQNKLVETYASQVEKNDRYIDIFCGMALQRTTTTAATTDQQQQ